MRHGTLAAMGLLVLTGLGGCVFSYDVTPPDVVYENDLDVGVVVSLEGEDHPYDRQVKAGTVGSLGTGDCMGTAMVVETEDGDPVGRIEDQACPGWTLTIHADGTLEYRES